MYIKGVCIYITKVINELAKVRGQILSVSAWLVLVNQMLYEREDQGRIRKFALAAAGGDAQIISKFNP